MIQVVDASAVVAALVDDTDLGRWCEARLAEGELVSPHLMPFEVANIVRRTVARGALDPSEGGAALHDLDRLQVDLVPFHVLSERARTLRANLTTYDASYIAAAELFGCRLVTLDRRLAAAPGVGCEVVVAPDPELRRPALTTFPMSSRPEIRPRGMDPTPEQDIRFGDPSAGPTAWAEVLRVLETAELFWISTVRRDGRPHVAPLPAVWHEDRLHFCTGPTEQKAVNIARNQLVALTTGCNRWKEGLDVVVEGEAVRVESDSTLDVLADLWRTKYDGDWDFSVKDGMFHHPDGGSAVVFEVAPAKVLAFSKGDFAQTRFRPLGRPSTT